MDKIKKVQDGWDGPYSYAPSSKLIDLSEKVMEGIQSPGSIHKFGVNPPSVWLDPTGEIVIWWVNDGISLHLDEDDGVLYYFTSPEKNYEFTHNGTYQDVLSKIRFS